MVNPKEVKQIATFITDDPDIFNEMAVSTGAIAMGPGNTPTKTRKRKKKSSKPTKKYYADPVTGQAKIKGGDEGEEADILFADTQSEETEETLE